MKKAALILSAAICAVTISVRAADWTDANDNEYTALKLLKGANSGYVVTGITPLCTDIVKMKFQPVAAVGALFCARNASASGMFTCYHSSTDGSIRIDRGAGSGSNQKTSNSKVSTGNDYLLTADYGKKTATIVLSGGGVDLFGKALGGADTYTVGSSLALFAMHSNHKSYSSYGTDYIYYFELYDSSGNLKHCLLPAKRDSDSVYGFYDTRTGTFYPQSGGALTAAERTVKVTDTCKKWTGRGDGVSMSDGANWEGGVAPQAGDNLDFTLAPPLAEINADIPSVTFGKLWLDDGDIPTFAGSMTVSDCNDRTKVVGNTSVVFSSGNYTWNGGAVGDWGAASAWTFDNASATWEDDNNAIFSTADAEATLAADVTANSLVFNANATVSGAKTLTTPTVSVASGVSATISAPTAGALAKIGAGTLTLTENRTDAATMLSEGTLALSGKASLDWSMFTFGTDADKPVTVRFEEGAELSAIPNSWYVGNVSGVAVTFVKDGGEWNAPQDLEVGTQPDATTTFTHKGGTLSVARNFFLGRNPSAKLTTLEISGGKVSSTRTGTGCFMQIGKTSDARVVVRNGAEFSVADRLVIGGEGNSAAKGTLDIEGGTVTVTDDLLFGYTGTWNGTGTVYLRTGGILQPNKVRFTYGVGYDNTFNFDGGTLKARSATTEFIKASDKLTVNVSENGGTIDNNGLNITIHESFNGPGTINLTGSGTTTFAAGVGAAGGVSVADGTTLALDVTEQSSLGLLTLAAGSKLALDGATQASFGALTLAAGSTLDIATPAPDVAAFAATTLNLPPEDTVVTLTSGGGAFVEGIYAICQMSGVTAADGEKFAPSTGELEPSWSVDGDTLILTVGAIDGNTWTGGANNGNLSDPDNWYGRAVPTSGTVTINTSGELTVGALFNPDVIVFPKTCGAVTIKGENTIDGLAAVTNLSSSICTFEVPVAFAGEICVSQGAYYGYANDGPALHDGGKVRFAGGVTGTSFADGTSRRLDGAYTIPATTNWTANTSDKLWTVAGGSSLTLTGYPAEQQTNDYSWLNNNGAFTTAVIRTSSRVCLRNEGEFVVTEELAMTLPGANRHISQRGSQGKYKFEKVTLGDNGNYGVFYFANSGNYYYDKHVYIGAGGLCFAEGAQPNTAYAFGRRVNDDIYIYPWHSDYTIGAKGGTTRDIIVIEPTYFQTDDADGVARTVTLNGVADVRAALTVKGHGRFQVNSDGMNGGGTGSITVTDSATLAYASGADLGAGAVTVGVNATMEIASGVNTFGGLILRPGTTLAFNFTKRTVTPQIAIAEGKTLTVEGEVKVKIPENSKWPTGGKKVLTTCGGFTDDKVSLVEGAPKWVRGLSVNNDGNIVLDVKPMGTKVIVR